MLESNKCYFGDCLDYMKDMSDNCIDLVLTDPPYGFNIPGKDKNKKSIFAKNTDWFDDSKRPDQIYFDELMRVSKNQIIFGGNYFSDLLPQSDGWLVWYKKMNMPTFADCELCWTSFKKLERIYQYRWHEHPGGIRRDVIKIHPTEKPYPLLEMIIKDHSEEGDLILDCFAGSCSTAEACIHTNRDFICIEKDETHFKNGEKRIKNLKQQDKLTKWF